MKKLTKLVLTLSLILIVSIITTGCATDKMDNIEIKVTNYANEYIANALYGDHAKISSIYPDGVNIKEYKLSSKQKQENSKAEIFIYNGLIEEEQQLAVELLSLNKDLKIIDTAYILESDYIGEELWLNPATLLMMSQNVKVGLKEYISSTYLQLDIDNNYNELKITLSELEVKYRESIEDCNNKVVVASDKSFKYLENLGLEVKVIDKDTTDKELEDIRNLFRNDKVDYIIKYKDTDLNKYADSMKNEMNVNTLDFHRLSNLSDTERDEKKDYLTIMEENLQALNQELYQ